MRKVIALLVLWALFAQFANATDLMALQGTVNVTTGNVTVQIWDSASGGTKLYDSGTDFVNGISNSRFDIMMGETTPLTLNYGVRYYMDLLVNGNSLTFGGNDRQIFQSSIGNISKDRVSDSGTWLQSEIPSLASTWSGTVDASRIANPTLLNVNNSQYFGGVALSDILANDTLLSARISAVNSSANIEALGFNTTAQLDLRYALVGGSYQSEASAFKLENVTALGYQVESSAFKIANISSAGVQMEVSAFKLANVTTLGYQVESSAFKIANISSAGLQMEVSAFKLANVTALGYQVESAAFKLENATSLGYQAEVSAFKLENVTALGYQVESSAFKNENMSQSVDASNQSEFVMWKYDGYERHYMNDVVLGYPTGLIYDEFFQWTGTVPTTSYLRLGTITAPTCENYISDGCLNHATGATAGNDAGISITSGSATTTTQAINLSLVRHFEISYKPVAWVPSSPWKGRTDIVGGIRTGTTVVLNGSITAGLFFMMNNSDDWRAYACNAGACTNVSMNYSFSLNYSIFQIEPQISTGYVLSAAVFSIIDMNGTIYRTNISTDLPGTKVAWLGTWTETRDTTADNSRIDYVKLLSYKQYKNWI